MASLEVWDVARLTSANYRTLRKNARWLAATEVLAKARKAKK